MFGDCSLKYEDNHDEVSHHDQIMPVDHHLDHHMEVGKGEQEHIQMRSFFTEEIEHHDAKEEEVDFAHAPSFNGSKGNNDQFKAIEERTEISKNTSNGCDFSCQTPIEFLLAYAESLKPKVNNEDETKYQARKLSNPCPSPSATTSTGDATIVEQTPVKAPRLSTIAKIAKDARAVRLEKTKVAVLQNYTRKPSQTKGRGRPKKPVEINRWGRAEDKELFATIRNLESKGLMKLQVIIDLKPHSRLCEVPDVQVLVKAIGWVSSPQKMVGRIQRLCETSSLSVREKKALRRCCKQYTKKGEVNFDSFLYHFPGIKKEILMKEYQQMIDDGTF